MTQKIVLCGMECEPCLGVTPIDVQTKYSEGKVITHNKLVASDVMVGSIKIPLRHRSRVFKLDCSNGWVRQYEGYAMGIGGDAYPCYEETPVCPMSVNENATFVDGSIYIADTEHSHAFWREVTYVCTFSGSSTDYVEFYPPINMAGKLRIDDVHYDVTADWYLAISGVTEKLFSESYRFNIHTPDNPLFFIEPQFGGNPLDADFVPLGEFALDGTPGRGFEFIDYRSHGGGPSDEEIASGGRDYYYPPYMRYMGIHRSEDAADAFQRFNDNYGSITRVHGTEVRNMMQPTIYGPSDARGSIVEDYNGNVFASVMVTKRNGTELWFNRLNGADPKLSITSGEITVGGVSVTDGGDKVEFSDLIRSYFPIGLTGVSNG